MKTHEERAHKYWENMMKGKCYTKGVYDSKTKYKVLATRKENYFSPDYCYLDYIHSLPIGTCYVDCE